MTVVIGINSLTEAIMIADSRVSWENGQNPPQDILRKLYTFGDDYKSVVLGFSGDLQSASIYMRALMERKLKNYKRPLVLSQFKDDLGRWLGEIAKTELSPAQRSKVRFMLGGIESSRHPPILRKGQVVGQTQFVEVHIYVYSIDKNGKVSFNTKPKGYEVIGTGRGLERAIVGKIEDAITFGFDQPQLHWARAVVMGEAVAARIQEDEIISKTVGGPYQVIRITPNGLETHYIWPPDAEGRNVEVQYDGPRVILTNSSSKEKYTLYPIWELPPLPVKGAG